MNFPLLALLATFSATFALAGDIGIKLRFGLNDKEGGRIVAQFDGAVEVERTAAGQPFTADAKTDEDYPSAAMAANGTVWAAWQSFTPGLDRSERTKSYVQEPADMKPLATAPGGDQLWLGAATGEAIAITPAAWASPMWIKVEPKK